jgi:exosortase
MARMGTMTSRPGLDTMPSTRYPTSLLVSLGIALLAVVWAYWTTFGEIAERWSTDPQYSHGFLVPLFSVYLIWSRRELFTPDSRGRWLGVGLVALGGGLRLAAHFLYQPWLDAGSLVVVLAGLATALGGRGLLKQVWPAVLFLVFMLPLPYRAQTLLGGQLQAVATLASTYALQTLGVPAVSEGNVILLSEAKLGVVEACSGLTMLVTFFALAAGVAMLAPRGWFVRVVLVLSAIPIAVASNVVRITVTGLLFEANQNELARVVFHDLAGWLMMPLGVTMLIAELYVLGRAVVPVGGPAAARQPGRPASTPKSGQVNLAGVSVG